MLIDTQVLTFAGLAAVLTITPGADTMLVIRSVVSRGAGNGLLTTAGICSGLFVHAGLSAAGLSLILLKSALAFEVLKIAGACYLVYLGLKSVARLIKKAPPQTALDADKNSHGRQTALRAFFEGMLNNILNPKPAVFYLAFLPQFIKPSDPVFTKSILLAGIHFVMSVIWLSMIAVFLGRMKGFLTNDKMRKKLEAASGMVLILLGIRLAMEKR